jgi:hypothetical protein
MMNQQTWAALQGQGITPQSLLRLDFSYNANSRAAAEALTSLVKDRTDYEVRVSVSGSIFSRRWRVEGTTQKTALSLETLEQWVTWMVTAGKECACDFDGWGTET